MYRLVNTRSVLPYSVQYGVMSDSGFWIQVRISKVSGGNKSHFRREIHRRSHIWYMHMHLEYLYIRPGGGHFPEFPEDPRTTLLSLQCNQAAIYDFNKSTENGPTYCRRACV